MKKIFTLLIAFSALFAFSLDAQSNLMTQPVYVHAFNLATLTNAQTVDLEFPKAVDGQYDFSFVIVDTEVSGTATNTIQLQQTICATCTDAWVNVGSGNAITDTGNSVMSAIGAANTWGYRYRLRAVNSGTGVHTIKVYAIARKRI